MLKAATYYRASSRRLKKKISSPSHSATMVRLMRLEGKSQRANPWQWVSPIEGWIKGEMILHLTEVD